MKQSQSNHYLCPNLNSIRPFSTNPLMLTLQIQVSSAYNPKLHELPFYDNRDRRITLEEVSAFTTFKLSANGISHLHGERLYN